LVWVLSTIVALQDTKGRYKIHYDDEEYPKKDGRTGSRKSPNDIRPRTFTKGQEVEVLSTNKGGWVPAKIFYLQDTNGEYMIQYDHDGTGSRKSPEYIRPRAPVKWKCPSCKRNVTTKTCCGGTEAQLRAIFGSPELPPGQTRWQYQKGRGRDIEYTNCTSSTDEKILEDAKNALDKPDGPTNIPIKTLTTIPVGKPNTSYKYNKLLGFIKDDDKNKHKYTLGALVPIGTGVNPLKDIIYVRRWI